jgi:hypothetical protein
MTGGHFRFTGLTPTDMKSDPARGETLDRRQSRN